MFFSGLQWLWFVFSKWFYWWWWYSTLGRIIKQQKKYFQSRSKMKRDWVSYIRSLWTKNNRKISTPSIVMNKIWSSNIFTKLFNLFAQQNLNRLKWENLDILNPKNWGLFFLIRVWNSLWDNEFPNRFEWESYILKGSYSSITHNF